MAQQIFGIALFFSAFLFALGATGILMCIDAQSVRIFRVFNSVMCVGIVLIAILPVVYVSLNLLGIIKD